jgi:hypothetical protein
MMSLASALPLTILVAFPSISSNSRCPSARDVESELSALLPAEGSQPGTALVVGLPSSLIVELRPDMATAAAPRSVEVGSDCDERARAAALLIATWWPGDRGETPRLQAVAKSSSFARRDRLAVAAGIFESVITDGIAAGIRAELSTTWGKLGLRASPSGTASHGAGLGRGRVEWRRLALEAGPTYGSGHVRLDVGFVASLLAVQGSGYSQDQGSTSAAMGATGGLRVSWAWKRIMPWLEMRALWWPQSQWIYVRDETTGLETRHDLPHAELQLAAGVALSLL